MPYNCPVPYAGVFCRAHGPVDIDYDEYVKQMGKPDALWVCPICRSTVTFNDDRYEELNPEPEE